MLLDIDNEFLAKLTLIFLTNLMIMKILKTFIFLGLLLTSQWAHSEYAKTDADFALLPPYCKARQEKGGANYDLWAKRFGPSFINMHHYCGNLHSINLAYKIFDRKKRQSKFELTIKELENTRHEFPLPSDSLIQAKISNDIGKIYEELDRNDDAMLAYQQSIKYKPKLPFSYSALSNLYIKQNKTEEAIEILKQGLKYKPDSKSLKKDLEKLTKGK